MLCVQKGDRDAFNALMEKHFASVMNLAARYLGAREEADDLAQEVFLKIYRARDRYRPDAKFTTWLYRITSNLCLNWIRSRKTRRTIHLGTLSGSAGEGDRMDMDPAARIEDENQMEPVDRLGQDEVHEAVRQFLSELPDRQRLAVVLNKYEDLGYQEIADVLGLTVTAVKSLLFRARETLKEKLGHLVHARAGAEE